MNAALTTAERSNARPLITCDSAERHKANAAEWYRRYCIAAHSGCGYTEIGPHGQPEALWDVYVRECRMAGLDPHDFAATTADKLAKVN